VEKVEKQQKAELLQKKKRSAFLDPLGLIGIAVAIGIWFAAAYYFQETNPKRAEIIMPSPVKVFSESLPELATFYGVGMGGEYGQQSSYFHAFLVIGYHSMITIGRLLAGVTIGIALGIGVGLLLGWSKYFRWLFELPILILRAIPALALIPLFLIWFGGKEYGNIFYIAFIVFSMIVMNTIVAISNVDAIHMKFASTQGANRGKVFRSVVLPAIIPELTGGIRVVIGVSWAITLAAEYLAAFSGLGRIMILSEKFAFTGRMIVIILLFMVYSLVLNWLVLKLINYITRWKPSD
jgi:ABC-type nitrate/sulfonate/bicarbonate transport system permease component